MEELRDLKERVEYLEAVIRSLGDTGSVPLEIGNALAGRIIKASSKLASSEQQAVNEGGVAQYTVCKGPDGFFVVNVEGVLRNVAYFD